MLTMDQLADLLRADPVFALLDEAMHNRLVKGAVKRELKKGERLVMQGDIWPYLFLVAEGKLDAVKVSGELAFQPISGRLARLLLDDFESTGNAAIARHLTLEEMAARVGTTREMVCRALYRFADKKLIDVTRTEFALTDKDGLRQIAEGS